MQHQTGLGWTPQSGDIVQLAARNRWDMPAGRYRLLKIRRNSRCETPDRWRLEGISCDGSQDMSGAMLAGAECAGSILPVDGGQLGRDIEEIRLRLHAPLMGCRSGKHKPQQGETGLDLFAAVDQPGLGL